MFGLRRPEDGRLVAAGHCVPVFWDDLPPAGWDWAYRTSFENIQRGITPNAVSALAISVDPEYRGTGVAQRAILAMRDIATRQGFGT